jgi:predicted nucleic acid-binding protein
MLRVVLDPVVMLRGLLNPHSPCRRLLFDYADRYRAVFSDNTLRLLRLLFLHPLIVARLPLLVKISPSRLARLFQYAERVRVPTEPDVSSCIALARAARADYVICEDQVLLSQCQEQSIPVLNTRAFLALLDPDLFLPT